MLIAGSISCLLRTQERKLEFHKENIIAIGEIVTQFVI